MLLKPSFLHRLQDDNPRDEEHGITPMYKRPEIVQSLMSDLNMLFSSRPLSSGTTLYGELPKSVLNYGVFDVIDVDISDNERIEALSNFITQALSWFEPRLENVVITLQNKTPESIIFWLSGVFIYESVAFSISWSSTAYTYTLNN